MQWSSCSSPTRAPASKVNKCDEPKVILFSGQTIVPDELTILRCENLCKKVVRSLPQRSEITDASQRTPTIDNMVDACAVCITKGEKLRLPQEQLSIDRPEGFLWSLLPESKTMPLDERLLPPLRGPMPDIPYPAPETCKASSALNKPTPALSCDTLEKCQTSIITLAVASCAIGAEVESGFCELEEWLHSEYGQHSLSTTVAQLRRTRSCPLDQSCSKTIEAGDAKREVIAGGYVSNFSRRDSMSDEPCIWPDDLDSICCRCVVNECERAHSLFFPRQASVLLDLHGTEQHGHTQKLEPWPFGRLQGNGGTADVPIRCEVREDDRASHTSI